MSINQSNNFFTSPDYIDLQKKYENAELKYNLNFDDIVNAKQKILKQKYYLMDIFKEDINIYSSRLNPKQYFSELNNRVNTICKIGEEQNLVPIFITITAPPKYHKKDINGNLIISPRTTARYLSKTFNDYISSTYYKSVLKKYDFKNTYFRVYEPHKSGVPHLHMLLYFPKEEIKNLKSNYYNYFTKKGNKVYLKKQFMTEFKKSAKSYIIKYILKSFNNANQDKFDLDDDIRVSWYIYYNIPLFLTSRSLIPLNIYRKIRHNFKYLKHDDMYQMTKLWNDGKIVKYNYEDCDLLSDDEKEHKYFEILNKNRNTIILLEPAIIYEEELFFDEKKQPYIQEIEKEYLEDYQILYSKKCFDNTEISHFKYLASEKEYHLKIRYKYKRRFNPLLKIYENFKQIGWLYLHKKYKDGTSSFETRYIPLKSDFDDMTLQEINEEQFNLKFEIDNFRDLTLLSKSNALRQSAK